MAGHYRTTPSMPGLDLDVTDLLIAPPGMPDQRFRNTVMIMTYSGIDQHLALCVNRRLPISMEDFLSRINVDVHSDQSLHWGGPVSPNTIWMLHDADWHTEGTRRLSEQISMTSSTLMFDHVRLYGWPKHYRVVSGYAAWAAGQLSAEIAGDPPWHPRSSWLLATLSDGGSDWLFETDIDDVWQSAVDMSSQQAIVNWL
jgi:putative transcriptional regulator